MTRAIRRLVSAFALSLTLASMARAATFTENFDDGTIDPTLSTVPAAGFVVQVDTQALAITKASGTGNGEALLRTDFLVAGDFTASAVIARVDLEGAAELGVRAVLQGNPAVEIFFVGGDTLKATVGGSTASEAQNAASATLRIRRTGNEVACEIDTGSGFVVKNSATGVALGKAKVRFEWFLRQTGGSTLAHAGRVDTIEINADHIQGGGSGGATPTPTSTAPTPTATATGPTPTPRTTPATVDYFDAYGVKVSKGTAPFAPLGPVSLPRLANGHYDVVKAARLLLPADAGTGGVHDAATHLAEYAVKLAKGEPKVPPLAGSHVLNACNDVFVTVGKAVSLLVPSAKDLTNPVTAPVNPPVDHFLCFAVKLDKNAPNGTALAKFPKGIQLDVADQFETRRYELTKPTKLCLPTAKSGAPVFLKGADKGTPAPLAPALVQHGLEHLLCYKAKLATARIEQLGCGPAVIGDKGTKIVPKQTPAAPRLGVFIANQLGTLRLDSSKTLEVCVPSFAELPIA